MNLYAKLCGSAMNHSHALPHFAYLTSIAISASTHLYKTLYTHTQTHTHRESHPFLFKHVAPEPERKNKDESDGSRTSDDIASPSTSSSNRHPSNDLAGRQQSDLFAIRWKTHKTFAHNQKCAIAVTLLQFIQFIWS